MPQIFHRRTNTVSRVSLAALALVILGSFGIAAAIYDSNYYTQVRVIHDQPVPFSHEHHVNGLGIDCRYCHQSVEKAAFAGLPSASTCMNCHSQMWVDSPMLQPVRESFKTGKPIAWTRVHDLPDFVYFNHSIHINKGIGCVSCHGRVDQMPLMWKEASLHMSWCLDCHRHPEKHVRPKDQVFNLDWHAPADRMAMGERLVKEYDIHSKTDCYTCHR